MLIVRAVLFYRCKPGASVRLHYIIAAAIWSIVGLLLLARGCAFLLEANKIWLVLPAIAIGTFKSIFLLDRSARKNSARLALREDGSCLGGIYSIKMWLLIGVMILMGCLLRALGLPPELLGVLYAAIGWSLFLSSRLLWNRVKQ